MKQIYHAADTRGKANFGWLNSRHTFSFGHYYDPERIQFGALRVLNDDKVAPGAGFETHPHRNMEIISIPLYGDLEHKDSMNNSSVIREGDIQVMSAGTGVQHSEYNHNNDKEVHFLQIWVLPNKQGVTPRYQQLSITDITSDKGVHQILSPDQSDSGVWIHQDAWFSIADLKEGDSTSYNLHKTENGVYFFVIDGEYEVNGLRLTSRDGLGVSEIGQEKLTIHSINKGRLLIMEVPV